MERELATLIVKWPRPIRGYCDLVPMEWFRREGKWHDRMHSVLTPKGEIRKALCTVTVTELDAELDYSERYLEENNREEIVPGIMLVKFENIERQSVTRVDWISNDHKSDLMNLDVDLLENVPEDLSSTEGQPRLRLHLIRERASGLRQCKIGQVLGNGGMVRCEACGFSFEEKYGDIGEDFCEVHHRVSLSSTGLVETSLSDLAILCSNCHRMIHKTDPMLSVEEFASRIVRN